MRALKKLSLVATLALMTLSSTGCLYSRNLRSLAQSGDKNVTLAETNDVYMYIFMMWFMAKHQFWKCSEVPGTITCKKECDASSSDLTCPLLGAIDTGNTNAIK